MPSSRDQFGEPKYDITLGKNCLDVQLSSRGHLVLIYEDHIELRNRYVVGCPYVEPRTNVGK